MAAALGASVLKYHPGPRNCNPDDTKNRYQPLEKSRGRQKIVFCFEADYCSIDISSSKLKHVFKFSELGKGDDPGYIYFE